MIWCHTEGCSPHKPCTPVFLVLCMLAACPDSFCRTGECGSCLSNASVKLCLKEEAVRDS